MSFTISIIIPVFNEEKTIVEFLKKLQYCRNEHCEVIVVDGGSNDKTLELAASLSDKTIASSKGRATQMRSGVHIAKHNLFLFLHADTFLPSEFFLTISNSAKSKENYWGRFDIRLTGNNRMFRVIESMINVRSRISGIATGDQAIFVNRTLYEKSGGFPEISLMEDVALSKKLKTIVSPLCLREKVTTSSRRWEEYGIWRTIWLMWRLRFEYFFGADPDLLRKKYQ